MEKLSFARHRLRYVRAILYTFDSILKKQLSYKISKWNPNWSNRSLQRCFESKLFKLRKRILTKNFKMEYGGIRLKSFWILHETSWQESLYWKPAGISMAISLPVTSRRRYYGSAISTYARKLRRGRNVGVFPNIISSGYFSMRAVKCTRRRDRALGKGGVCAFQEEEDGTLKMLFFSRYDIYSQHSFSNNRVILFKIQSRVELLTRRIVRITHITE